MRSRTGLWTTWLALYVSVLLGTSSAAGVDLGLCDPIPVTCDCGSSGVVQVDIPACTWFYRWRPYCRACERNFDESALCSQYTNCLECSNVRGQGCTRCPPGRAGRQCNEVPVARIPTTPSTTTAAPPGSYCDSNGNRYVPINGCTQYEQYDLGRSVTEPAGTLPCPAGLLFDVNICTCNWPASVQCGSNGGGVTPRPTCLTPAQNSLPNGRVVVLGAPDSATQRLRYECNNGYVLRGAGTNECIQGQWANQPPRCDPEPRVVTCPPPQLPPHAVIVREVPAPVTRFTPGTTVYVRCNPGYQLSGSRNITCTPDGTWQIDSVIVCTASPYCEDPGTPRNAQRQIVEPRIGGEFGGRYRPRSGTSRRTQRMHVRRSRLGRQAPEVPAGRYPPDTRLLFRCDRYYELVGPSARACGADGQWSGRQPVCLPECGEAGASRTAFITNGNATEKGQWPWQVALSRDDLQSSQGTFQLVCGGALLNEHWVVTAAHCVTEAETGHVIRTNHIKIHLGRHYRELRRADVFVQQFDVERILVNEHFNPYSLDADIALLRLSGPGAQLSVRVRPVCLPESESDGGERLQAGNEGVVTGWGRTEQGGDAGALRQANIPVIDSQVCEDSYRERGFNVPVTDYMYCAGYADGGIDACAGDSGGPMMFSEGSGSDRRWYLEGLVSWGSPTGECGTPAEYGGYTKVSAFLDWIRATINL